MSNVFICVSGSRGVDGFRGFNGAHGGTGGRGGDGGDGAHGAHGQRAGSVDVTLSVDEMNKKILIAGEINAPGASKAAYQKFLSLGDTTNNLCLEGVGGDGGNGGDGGYGGKGGRGFKGRNATQYSSGGNGGPGGNGGNGGRGGNGGNGGEGGTLIVRVQECDLDTLMLLHKFPRCSGGKGGIGGAGGAGGKGGSGGPGGDSFHWTTTEYRTAYYADGTSYTQTIYHSHSQPGGYSGPSGNAGFNGHCGSNGFQGSNGNFSIYVGGIRKPWRYNLKVLSVSYYSTKRDEIIEPGCIVHVFPTYENDGNCYTPTHQNVYGYLENNKWVNCGRQYQVALERKVCHSTRLESPIVFKVTPVDKPTQGDPLRETGVMDHRAYVDRVNLEFEDIAAQSTKFPIQYPVEMAPIRSSSAISAGEQAPIIISLENCSSRAIGIATDTKRVLRLRIQAADEAHQIPDVDQVDRKEFTFIREDGSIVEEETFTHEFENLRAKTIEHFRFTLRFHDGVEPYSFAVLTVSLDLGSIDDYSSYKTIQQRTFRIQLAESYGASQTAKNLLVVNSRTLKQEVKAWKRLFETIRQEVVIYNISLYRGMDMNYNRITDGKNLIDDFAGGGLIIFLNNKCRDHDSELEKTPFSDFSNIYPLQLIQQFAIRLLILGESEITTNLLVPLPQLSYEADPSLHYKSIDSFLNTGIDRVCYHLLQSKKLQGIFYTSDESIELPEATSDSPTLSRQRNLKRSSSRKSTRELMSRSLLNELANPKLERASSFLSVSPEISILKAAQVQADFSGSLLKKRKDHHKVKRVSGWQKRFFTLRMRDQTLSWYLSATAKNPKGVLDLKQPFMITIQTQEPEEGKSPKEPKHFTFQYESKARSLVLRVKARADFEKWMELLRPLASESLDVASTREVDISIKCNPANSLILSPQVRASSGVMGVDDVFYGWVNKKAPFTQEQKRFIILRVHDMTLSFYSDDNLWIPRSVIHANVVQVVRGWQKPIKASEANEAQEVAGLEDADSNRFTLMTPWKHYYFKANINSQPSVDDWISRIDAIHEHNKEANEMLSSKRHISRIPERHAVIPANEQLLFWKSPTMSNLQSRGKALAKKLNTRFPSRRFLVVTSFDGKDNKKLRSGSALRPKHFLGTLKIFETLKAFDCGLLVHDIPDERFHSQESVDSPEILHYVLRALKFETRLHLLRSIDEFGENGRLEQCLISSFVSDLVQEIVMCRKSSLDLSEHVMQSELCLINLFVQFNWSNNGGISKQPQWEGDIKPGSKIESILIAIIGSVRALFKSCSALSNLWSTKGTVIKLVKARLSFLVDRISRLYSKEDKKFLLSNIAEYKKTQFKSFAKKSSAKSSTHELQFPFHSNSECVEFKLTTFAGDAVVLQEEDFVTCTNTEINRQGRGCCVVENANSCASQEDRLRILDDLLSRV